MLDLVGVYISPLWEARVANLLIWAADLGLELERFITEPIEEGTDSWGLAMFPTVSEWSTCGLSMIKINVYMCLLTR